MKAQFSDLSLATHNPTHNKRDVSFTSKMTHRIYFWRVKDFRGRWYKTRYRTDAESIRKEHPEAERIEADSMEIPDFDPCQDRCSPTMQGRVGEPVQV